MGLLFSFFLAAGTQNDINNRYSEKQNEVKNEYITDNAFDSHSDIDEFYITDNTIDSHPEKPDEVIVKYTIDSTVNNSSSLIEMPDIEILNNTENESVDKKTSGESAADSPTEEKY